jgi:uncharacterized cupin superfamily protein
MNARGDASLRSPVRGDARRVAPVPQAVRAPPPLDLPVARYAYPHTIENGAGERLTFLRRVPGRRGDRVEGENAVAPGAGPPMHVHHRQEEALTVQQGRLGYQRLGEPERFAGPGETVTFAAGEAHRFWNAGEDELRCTAHVEPADNVEYFLTEIFASQRRRGGTRPDPFDAAFLVRRYGSEFAMLEVPAAVQRLVFPVLVRLGTLLGRYARYADAPEPVRG